MIKRGIKRTVKNRVSEIEKLNYLVKILGDSFEKLKEAYEKRDSEEFNRLKKIIILTQRKIFQTTKGAIK